jgi:hypothetical protein
MKSRLFLTILVLLTGKIALSADSVFSFRFRDDVTITIDRPQRLKGKHTQLIIYALPNGNSTAQTMGKRMQEGDDWHFDIQHIKAQTGFIRNTDPQTNYVVAYLENDLKSWPAWTTRNAGQNLLQKLLTR